MRLEDAPDLTVWVIFRRCQSCRDLLRMMRVIIDDGHTADLALFLESAVSTCKSKKSVLDSFSADSQLMSRRDGRQGIVYIVDSRNAQCNCINCFSVF